jgi:hypothetical protein
MSYGGPGRFLAETLRTLLAYWKIRKSTKANVLIKKRLVNQLANLSFGLVFTIGFLPSEIILAIHLSKNKLNGDFEFFIHLLIFIASLALALMVGWVVEKVLARKMNIK